MRFDAVQTVDWTGRARQDGRAMCMMMMMKMMSMSMSTGPKRNRQQFRQALGLFLSHALSGILTLLSSGYTDVVEVELQL